jgi:hypothetical protein
MIYVIEGDIVLLSQAALKDLGVIPQNFPMIGGFSGVQQIGDGSDNLQVDSNLNVKNIAVDVAEVTDTMEIPELNTKINEEMLGPEEVINDGSAYIHQTAVRQPPGECDPESDLPCSFMPKEEFHRPAGSATDACHQEQHTGTGKLDQDPL